MIRRVLLPFFMAAALAATVAAGDPLPYEITSVLRHDDWISGLLEIPDTRIGRAATAETDAEPALLALDTAAGECGVWRMVVLLPADRMEGPPLHAYEMRIWIDGTPVGEGVLETTPVQGSRRLRLAWREPLPDQALPAALRSGGSMRLALLGPEGDALRTIDFSLAGATGALARAAALCAGTVHDQPFFPYPSS